MAALSSARQRTLLDAARRGDETAYGALVEAYRGELHAHCYRMLGSAHDAEDALQDTLLRAWRGLPRFEQRSSLRSWLYRIATNACLDVISGTGRRQLPTDFGPATDAHDGPGPPLTETAWIEPFPDQRVGLVDGRAAPAARYEQREAVELAFIAALQHLPASQRATLILCEVLGFSAKEAAETLETSVPAVNSALQRARRAVEEKLPAQSQQATLRTLDDEDLRRIVDGYVEAWERGDVDGIAAMLAHDAAITMPPMATWFRGEQLFVFLREWAFNGRVYGAEGRRRVRVVPARANGQLAFGTYSWDEGEGVHLPTVLQVLTLDADRRITEITGFVTPDVYPLFGLPRELP
ncbi:sigma-70 family RNA polymerase sigma factor [Paraconexibacter algicola]|uniref:RNA polymerase subunit sigma-70 n=1 Tax=Paraconexibacter algicola TaxID=2133960 RepID=A0A2T4UBY4_9ACTN|nr:sigma-70 family RNA polymerase sigma factor [Paraconexibacter algicola]PTL54409.1 RNA polymerase subunit sigma-70 [Paraconexibacter algicola]